MRVRDKQVTSRGPGARAGAPVGGRVKFSCVTPLCVLYALNQSIKRAAQTNQSITHARLVRVTRVFGMDGWVGGPTNLRT